VPAQSRVYQSTGDRLELKKKAGAYKGGGDRFSDKNTSVTDELSHIFFELEKAPKEEMTKRT